jgi:hypothetical protein
MRFDQRWMHRAEVMMVAAAILVIVVGYVVSRF